MATPVIQTIAAQNILIDTAYALSISITNSPAKAWVEGDLESFNTDWNASTGILKIEGTPDREVAERIWIVYAEDSADSTNIVQKTILYSVIPKAPIIGTLPDIHLYRNVDLNIDISIQNVGEITAKSLLIGMKSHKTDEGAKIDGKIPKDATFTKTQGNINIVAQYTGGASPMRDFAWTLETGVPPQLGAVSVIPKGNYAEISFTDLSHAISYEWLREDLDNLWHNFSSGQNVIDPSTVKVTPGNLQAQITFGAVTNANAYQYRLNTEDKAGVWVDFIGTLSNSMVTTIIPHLEEGVQYTLQLRVASPWIGEPINITIIGGRLCYTLQINASDRDNQWLYLFSTGFTDGATVTRTKRLLLPTTLTHPQYGGLAVNADGDVFILNLNQGASNEKALYVFEASTINSAADGSRLTQDRKHNFPANASNSSGGLYCQFLAEYNNELYMYFYQTGAADWRNKFRAFAIPQTDGVVLSSSRTSLRGLSVELYGFSVDQYHIWYKNQSNRLRRSDRQLAFTQNPVTATTLQLYNKTGASVEDIGDGLKVIGEVFYTIDNGEDVLKIYKLDPAVHATRHVLTKQLSLPSGLSNAQFLDIPV